MFVFTAYNALSLAFLTFEHPVEYSEPDTSGRRNVNITELLPLAATNQISTILPPLVENEGQSSLVT